MYHVLEKGESPMDEAVINPRFFMIPFGTY